MSLQLRRWNSDSSGEVFSPSLKSWERNGTLNDTFGGGAPTPRIYVLPSDSPEKGLCAQIAPTSHSRTRSEVSVEGRVGMPDVTILDMKYSSKDSGGEEDSEMAVSTSMSRPSSVFQPTEDSESDVALDVTSLELPTLHTVDAELGNFVQSLPNDRLTYMLSVMIEEVLPRPDSGLLKRMLRMSEIPVGMVEGSGEPILHLRVGSECHVSIGLIKLNGGASSPLDISGPHGIRLKPLDGNEVDLNATCEAVDQIEHVTSAFWDLKSHASQSLSQIASGDLASSTVLTPIEMTLYFHVHYHEEGDLIKEIEVKKTFMASMRRELVTLDVDQRFVYEDAVLDFVLSKMELISMPSLLMFLEVEPAAIG